MYQAIEIFQDALVAWNGNRFFQTMKGILFKKIKTLSNSFNLEF